MDLLTDLQTALPEAFLAGYGLVALLLGAIVGDKGSVFLRLLSSLALAGASALAFVQFNHDAAEAFNGLYQVTPFIAFGKGMTYAMAALSLFMAGGFLKAARMERYEFSLLTVFASMGAGVMLSANDFMTLYIGLETMSIASYVLAAFRRDSLQSAEAGLKYFVLGALASGLLLYGASLIYGFAGGTSFAAASAAEPSVGLVFGLVLIICGMAFKASAAPFHVWTPDVYQGAPSPVVAFFATAPKIAAVLLLANVLFKTFGPHEESWRLIMAIIAAASMVIGSVGALMQTNVKRLLAYSSISNVGFALIAVAAGEGAGGASAVMIYMVIYVIATLGLFGGVIALRRGGTPVDEVSDLNGLMKLKPAMTLGLLILIFSVAGIPPMAGFWGKLKVLQAGLEADMLWLVLVGLASSVVAVAYYLRIIWAMVMKPAGEKLDGTDWTVAATVFASSIIIFPLLPVFIQKLLDVAAHAAAG